MPVGPGQDAGWNRGVLVLPAVAVFGHVLACVAGLAVDWWIVHLVVVAMAAIGSMAALLRTGWRTATAPVWWIGLALAWLMLIASHGVGVPPVPTLRLAWVSVDAVAMMVSLAVAGASFVRLVRSLAVGLLAALGLAIVMSLVLDHPHVGLGMMNHLIAFALPVIVAWVAMSWGGSGTGTRWLLGSVLVGVVCWMWLGHPEGPRRGGMLALVVGLAAPHAITAMGSRPRTAIVGLLLLLGGLVVAWGWAVEQDAVREFRTQRVGIWRASLEGIAAWWPSGGGVWSSLRLGSLPADAARPVSSGNAAFDHPHNEFLAILQDHGLAGMLLAAAGLVLLVIPILRQPRTPVRDGAVALAACTGVFLVVENAYSLPSCRIMLGATAGLLLAVGWPVHGTHRRLGQRLAITVAALSCLAGGWWIWSELPAALLPRAAGRSDLASAVRTTNQPQVADILVGLGVRRELEARSLQGIEAADHVTSLALERFGPGPGLMRWRFQAVCAMADQFLRVSPGRAPTYGIRLLTDEVCHVAEAVLHADPFVIQAYQAVAAIDRLGYADRADQTVVRRARLLAGRLTAPAPPIPPYTGLEAVTDAWAYLTWKLSPGWTPEDHLRMSELLSAGLALHGVQSLAVAAMSADPAGSDGWIVAHALRLKAIGLLGKADPSASRRP